MKAYAQSEYGDPGKVLSLLEVDKPSPAKDEVRIRVMALSLNPAERHLIRGAIWLVRLSNGLTRPKNPYPGADVAGEVEAIGENIALFKVGDKVFGRAEKGGLAEFACLKEEQCTFVPENLPLEYAASLPIAAITALTAVQRKGKVKQGDEVLINGASGGVGTFAVQLAKHYGARVTAICSGKNKSLVRSLGADHVIDYTTTDFSRSGNTYDLVIDLVGNRSIDDFRKVVAPGGRCVFAGYTRFGLIAGQIFKGMAYGFLGDQKFVVMNAEMNGTDLADLARMCDKGILKVVIDRMFVFEDLPETLDNLGKKRTKGKLVCLITHSN